MLVFYGASSVRVRCARLLRSATNMHAASQPAALYRSAHRAAPLSARRSVPRGRAATLAVMVRQVSAVSMAAEGAAGAVTVATGARALQVAAQAVVVRAPASYSKSHCERRTTYRTANRQRFRRHPRRRRSRTARPPPWPPSLWAAVRRGRLETTFPANRGTPSG